MVRFSAGDGAWLAPVDDVLGVRAAAAVRAMPDPAPGIVGVIDRDGEAWPVSRALGDGDFVLLVGDGEHVVGVLTDAVRDVAEVDEAALARGPSGQGRRYVEATHGSGADLAYVLDAAELVRAVFPDDAAGTDHAAGPDHPAGVAS